MDATTLLLKNETLIKNDPKLLYSDIVQSDQAHGILVRTPQIEYLYYIAYGWVQPFILLLGLIGNTLNLCVLLNPRRRHVTHILMRGMSIADTITVYTLIPIIYYRHMTYYNRLTVSTDYFNRTLTQSSEDTLTAYESIFQNSNIVPFPVLLYEKKAKGKTNDTIIDNTTLLWGKDDVRPTVVSNDQFPTSPILMYLKTDGSPSTTLPELPKDFLSIISMRGGSNVKQKYNGTQLSVYHISHPYDPSILHNNRAGFISRLVKMHDPIHFHSSFGRSHHHDQKRKRALFEKVVAFRSEDIKSIEDLKPYYKNYTFDTFDLNMTTSEFQEHFTLSNSNKPTLSTWWQWWWQKRNNTMKIPPTTTTIKAKKDPMTEKTILNDSFKSFGEDINEDKNLIEKLPRLNTLYQLNNTRFTAIFSLVCRESTLSPVILYCKKLKYLGETHKKRSLYKHDRHTFNLNTKFWAYYRLYGMYFLVNTVFAASTFVTMSMAIERLITVYWPLKCHRWCSRSRTRLMVFTSFFVALMISLPLTQDYVVISKRELLVKKLYISNHTSHNFVDAIKLDKCHPNRSYFTLRNFETTLLNGKDKNYSHIIAQTLADNLNVSLSKTNLSELVNQDTPEKIGDKVDSSFDVSLIPLSNTISTKQNHKLFISKLMLTYNFSLETACSYPVKTVVNNRNTSIFKNSYILNYKQRLIRLPLVFTDRITAVTLITSIVNYYREHNDVLDKSFAYRVLYKWSWVFLTRIIPVIFVVIANVLIVGKLQRVAKIRNDLLLTDTGGGNTYGPNDSFMSMTSGITNKPNKLDSLMFDNIDNVSNDNNNISADDNHDKNSGKSHKRYKLTNFFKASPHTKDNCATKHHEPMCQNVSLTRQCNNKHYDKNLKNMSKSSFLAHVESSPQFSNVTKTNKSKHQQTKQRKSLNVSFKLHNANQNIYHTTGNENPIKVNNGINKYKLYRDTINANNSNEAENFNHNYTVCENNNNKLGTIFENNKREATLANKWATYIKRFSISSILSCKSVSSNKDKQISSSDSQSPSGRPSTSSITWAKQAKKEKNLTHLLLAISILFTLSVTPQIFVMTQGYAGARQNSYGYHIFTAVANLLEIANYSLDFFLYCMCSADYRRHLKRFLRHVCRNIKRFFNLIHENFAKLCPTFIH